jgi:N-acyl-L-homoserine lactone synthetase
MLLIVDQQNRTREHLVLRSMFEARKRVFIDLLKWDLPALAGRYELDQFDNEDAIYLIVATEEGDHLASARLLLTTRPALLDTLFPGLVEGEVPQGPDVLEITRFCLSPGIGREQRCAIEPVARETLAGRPPVDRRAAIERLREICAAVDENARLALGIFGSRDRVARRAFACDE